MPSRARWVMLALIFVTTVLNYVDRANLALTAPAIAKELGEDPARIGWLLSAFGWSYALCQVPGGWLVDRLRPRTLLFALLALWSLCTVGIGFVSTLAGIFALRLAVGLLEAPSYPVNNRVITVWFPQNERASAAATFLSGQFVGLAFCMPVLAWVQEHHGGWRAVFHVTGVAGIVWACIWYAVYRDPGGAASAKASTSWRDLGALLTRRKLWGIYIGQFAVSTTLWFFLTWFPTYLTTYRGMSSMRAGVMASVPYIAALVGVLTAGLVSDALLRQGFSLGFARKTPIITGLALAMSIAGASFVDSEGAIIAFMATAFFGCGMASITWSVVSAIAPTRLLGLTSGVFNLLGNSAAVVTPLVVGKLAGSSGFAPALLYVAGIAAIGVVAYVVLVGEVYKLPDPRFTRSIVVMGAAGSGKTTIGSALAGATGMRFVEGDDLHSAANKAKMARGEGLNDEDRAPWLAQIAQELRRARAAGTPVVVACSALKRAYRDVLRQGDPDLQLVFIEGGADVLREHLKARTGHFVGESLLASQLATLEPPGGDEAPIVVSAACETEDAVARIVRG